MSRLRAVPLALLALPALLAMGGAAHAGDILILKDGRIFETDRMDRTPTGIDVHFKNGDVHVPSELIQDSVLAADAARPPVSDEEKENLAKGFVRYDGKWLSIKMRDEAVAKKIAAHKKMLEDIRAHGEWRNRYQEESKVFHYHYTVPPHIFAEYKEAMEAYYALFAKTWKISAPKNVPKLPVNIYYDAESYHQISGAPGGALAYFRFVKPWDLNTYYERLDNEFAKHVLFHEANHYLQLLVDVNFAVPHFPGESMAEYYGASHWEPETKKFTTGLIQEGRLCEIQADIDAGEKMSLEKLLTQDGSYAHYTWGWSLVHFLMNDARYADKFQKFFFALSRGKNVRRDPMGRDNLVTCTQEEAWRVFKEELGLKDNAAVRKLEAEWYDYIDQKLKLVTDTGMAQAGFALASQNRPIKAKRFLNQAIEKGSRNPMVFHKLAELYFADGKESEGMAMLDKAIAMNPLEGQFYDTLGRHLKLKGDAEKSAKLIALAAELGYESHTIEIDDGDESSAGKGGKKPKDPNDPKGGE